MKTSSLNPKIYSLLLLLAMSICIAKAQTSNDDKTGSPYFKVLGDNIVDGMPLLHTGVDVNVIGVIADVTVTQVYKNKGKVPLEAVYVFPASTRAAIYGLEMDVAGKKITATIKEREQARKDYEAAKGQGKSATLLEQERPNVFTMNVANILPGEAIHVTLHYTEMLVPTDGVYEFVYPTVVGPRYHNSPPLTASTETYIPNNTWIDNPYLKEGQEPSSTFDIKVSINAGMPIAKAGVNTHQVNVSYKDKDQVFIGLKPEECNGGNRDYILQYRLKGEQINTGILLFPGEQENFFMAMIQPPKSVTPEQLPGREYIFVVDISGSMSGFPIETSKKLLKELIGSLKPTDVFNVLTFAGSSGIMHPTSVAANKENIAKAINTIENYQGGGGTELLPALTKGLNLPKHDGYSRSFVIATDGYITVEKEAFELMRDKLGDANFFTFGIGSSVNRFLLEGMARVGKGETFVITDPNDAPKYAAKFKKYVESPVLTHVKVNYGNLTAYDVEPTAIPDVLADRPIIVIGKYKGTPTGKITVTGDSGNGKFTTELDLATASISTNHSALKYLWARTRVQMLGDYNSFGFGNDKESIKKEVTELGLKYNMMTAYTSFIAIDERVRTNGNPTTVNQPLPLPAGVSDDAVGGNYGNVNYRTNGSGAYKSKGSTNTYMISPAPALEETELDGMTISTDNSNQPIISVCDSVSYKNLESEEIMMVAEVMPAYPGGEKAMMEFIKNNLKYPTKSKEAGISGTVYIEVVVGKDGTLSNSKVARGVSAELDAAALEVIKKLGKFIPGSNGGKLVAVKMVLPVRFIP
jgi:Ca-activated chloride channel family protein